MLEKCVLTILESNWNQRFGGKKTILNSCHDMLTSSTKLQIHVVGRTRTSSKYPKMKNARAKRAKILFFIVKYANLRRFSLPLSSWLLKLSSIARRQQQQQRHKLRILYVELGKISVLHVRHALKKNSVPASAKQQLEITITSSKY